MKVMYILHSCMFDGSTISFLNLVKEIRAADIDVVVVHPKPDMKDEILIQKLLNFGCKCIEARVAFSFINKTKGFVNIIKFIIRFLLIIIRKILFYRDLNIIVKKERPNIIHTNTGVVHEGYLIAKKYKIPHIWHLREYQEKDFNWIIFPSKYYFEKMLNNSYSICITKDIQKFFNLNKCNKSFVIYNPIMSSKYNKYESIKSKLFLVANRLSPDKGIEDILYAYSIFSKNNPDYSLLLLGFGKEIYINKLKQLCKKINIESSVEFLGFKEDVYTYMAKAKTLLVGSINEGFGRMTAEANMLGTPVIGRNTGGTKEILEHTKGGFLFDTVEQMTEYMRKIASYSELETQEFMKNPQKIAIKLFSTEQHVQKVLNLYNLILCRN